MKLRFFVLVAFAVLFAATLLKTHTVAADGEAAAYAGPVLCKMCHKKLDNSGPAWDASKHSQALAALSSDDAKKYSANPATDEKCLACHTTGFGKDSGYKPGGDNSKTENVTCEACHGAGSNYKSKMSKLSEAFDAGLILPSVAVCVRCHNSTSPTFKEFHFQDAFAVIRHGKEDAMKTPPVAAAYKGKAVCIMCHKSKDTSVTVYEGTKHAKALDALKTDEAKKYSADPLKDQFCLACHTTGLTDKGGYDPAAGDDDKAKLAGVQCESCHGPGEKYMKTMSKPEDAVANGLVMPTENTCRKCHNPLSPSFKEFKFDDAVKAIAHGKK